MSDGQPVAVWLTPYWWLSLAAFLAAAGAWALACARGGGAVRALAAAAGRVFWHPAAKYFLAAAATVATAYTSATALYWRHQISDESAYLLQARTYAAGMLSLPVETRPWPFKAWNLPNRNFLTSPLEAVVRGRKVVIYSPVYSAALALPLRFGSPWLLNAVATGAVVLLGAAAAARAWGPRAGAAAAWFFAASPAVLLKGVTYFPESVSLALLCLLALLFFAFRERGGVARGAALGAVAGVLVAIREYAGLAVVVPFAVAWLAAAVKRRRWGDLALIPAAALLFAPVLAYNWRISGAPLFFPRWAGPISYFGIHNFGDNPSIPLIFNWTRVALLNNDALGWPYFSLLPVVLLFAVVKRKTVADYLFLAVGSLTVLAFVPVDNPGVDYGTRYLLPAAAALVFLAARVADRCREALAARGPASWRPLAFLGGVLPLLILLGVGNACGGLWRELRGPLMATVTEKLLWETPALRETLRRLDIHDAVVFIGPFPHGLGAMPNSPRLDDDVVFARDQGDARNYEFMALFPGRRFFRCDYDELERTRTLAELTPSAATGR